MGLEESVERTRAKMRAAVSAPPGYDAAAASHAYDAELLALRDALHAAAPPQLLREHNGKLRQEIASLDAELGAHRQNLARWRVECAECAARAADQVVDDGADMDVS